MTKEKLQKELKRISYLINYLENELQTQPVTEDDRDWDEILKDFIKSEPLIDFINTECNGTVNENVFEFDYHIDPEEGYQDDVEEGVTYFCKVDKKQGTNEYSITQELDLPHYQASRLEFESEEDFEQHISESEPEPYELILSYKILTDDVMLEKIKEVFSENFTVIATKKL